MNEQVATAIKILRKQAQDNLALADWLEQMKVVDAPPVQEETHKN